MSASLLQDVLRPHAFGPGVNQLGSRLAQASLSSPPSRHDALDDSDDELVGVVSPKHNSAHLYVSHLCVVDVCPWYTVALQCALTPALATIFSYPHGRFETKSSWASLDDSEGKGKEQ